MQDTQALVELAKTAAQAQNTFGVKLLMDLAAQNAGKNTSISPLSLYLALAMAEAGSAGGTRSAMRRTLVVPGTLTADEFHESVAALSHLLRTRRDVELSIANALWSDTGFPLAPAYVKQCRDLFGADATNLDFQRPEAAGLINSWVKENTGGKIPNIVSREQVASSKTMLTNAVYFKGRWRNPFLKEATKDGVFHLAGGGEKKVPLMHQDGLHRSYRSGEGFEAAELIYGHSNMGLFAILPAKGRSPEDVVAGIVIEELIRSAQPVELELTLPRFTLDLDAPLNASLSRMGMAVAFEFPGAEFAPMGSPLLFLGDVIHKTRLEIDEEGTVAAAATAIHAVLTAMLPVRLEKRVLIFDRPFALLLVDHSTRAIVFAGVVYEP